MKFITTQEVTTEETLVALSGSCLLLSLSLVFYNLAFGSLATHNRDHGEREAERLSGVRRGDTWREDGWECLLGLVFKVL